MILSGKSQFELEYEQNNEFTGFGGLSKEPDQKFDPDILKV